MHSVDQDSEPIQSSQRSFLSTIFLPHLFFWVGLGGMIPFILFHWLTQSYLRVIAWPWMLAWQLGFITMILLGIGMLRHFKHPFRLLGYGLEGWVILFLLALILSTFFAPFPPVALWNMSRILSFVILLYVGRNYFNTDWIAPKISLSQLWFGVVTVGLITGIISLALWRPSPEMWLSQEFNDALRNHLPLGNNNFMGGYAVLILPLTIAFTLAHTGRKRIFGIGASLIAAILLYSSGSRGALLGAIVIVILFAWAAFLETKGKQRLITIVLSIFAFLVMGLALFSNPRIRQFLVAGGLEPAIQAFLQDGPVKDRIVMLQSLGNLFHDRPWVGVGAGNMSLVYNLYRPMDAGNWSMHVQQLHNTPAQILGELGLFGLLAYLGFLGYVSWLICKLYRQWETPFQRYLSLGIGISLLGYATSSLTDYQLENIGISTLLIANLWLLTALLDSSPTPLPFLWGQAMILKRSQFRRVLSLVIIGFLGFCLSLWLPINTAAAVSLRATRQAIAGNFVAADQGWSQSARWVPWDPIYAAVAGQKLLQLSEQMDNSNDRLAVKEQSIEYYRQAVAAAPHDAFFNHNLAVILLESHPQEAIDYAQRSAALQNRDSTYSYYTLGLAYRNTQQPEKAIDAFVLQGLSRPSFLTLTLAKDPALQDLKAEIIQRSLSAFKQLLETTPLNTPGYVNLEEQILMVRWWNQDILPSELSSIVDRPLRPIVKALLLAETQPERSIEILNKAIETEDDAVMPALHLFRAWLNPDRYFADFSTILETPEQRAGWQENLTQYRNLRDWFGSILATEVSADRLALWLTYRNMNAVNAAEILLPPEIIISRIAKDLNLYPELPRYFPPLDRLIENYRNAQGVVS